MVKKPNGWEECVASDGNFKKLPAGGHVCKILSAKEMLSKAGHSMLVICFDIDGGEFDGYYMDMYSRAVTKNAATGEDAKWPNAGVYRQVMEGNSMSIAKGMIQNIMKSNPGYEWDWDETKLKDKKFGGVFQEEEYEGRDAKGNSVVKTAVKCIAIRPVEGIEDIEPPAPKKLAKSAGGSSFGGGFGGGLSDEEIPF